MRTTLHWQPSVDVESPINYTLVMEGVGENGTLLSIEKQMGRGNNNIIVLHKSFPIGISLFGLGISLPTFREKPLYVKNLFHIFVT